MQNKFDIPFGPPPLLAQRIRLCDMVEQIRLTRCLGAAIQQNDVAAVQFWLSEGADPNAFDNLRHRAPALILGVVDFYDDDTPYLDEDELVVDGTHYFVPAPGNTTIMAALLDAGAEIDAKELSGETALMLAARFSPAATVAFLVARGAAVNARYYYDRSALHYAATVRDVGVVRAFLDGGADINAQDRAGRTPLMEAIDYMLTPGSSTWGKTASVEELLNRGADTGIRDVLGRRVLDYFPRGLACPLWYDSRIAKLRKMIRSASRR